MGPSKYGNWDIWYTFVWWRFLYVGRLLDWQGAVTVQVCRVVALLVLGRDLISVDVTCRETWFLQLWIVILSCRESSIASEFRHEWRWIPSPCSTLGDRIWSWCLAMYSHHTCILALNTSKPKVLLLWWCCPRSHLVLWLGPLCVVQLNCACVCCGLCVYCLCSLAVGT